MHYTLELFLNLNKFSIIFNQKYFFLFKSFYDRRVKSRKFFIGISFWRINAFNFPCLSTLSLLTYILILLHNPQRKIKNQIVVCRTRTRGIHRRLRCGNSIQMESLRKCMCTKNHCKRLFIQYHRQRRIILCCGLQHRRHIATNAKVCYGVLQGKVLDALNAESNAMKNAKIYWMPTAYKVCY